jgi:hypothetical protein
LAGLVDTGSSEEERQMPQRPDCAQAEAGPRQSEPGCDAPAGVTAADPKKHIQLTRNVSKKNADSWRMTSVLDD